jgi:hypothetical protein
MAEKNIKSVNLLPEFLRTEKNKKFLSSTIDQLIQKPELERLDGFIGSTLSPNYRDGDVYITESSPLRQNYQLEPSLIIKTESDNILDVIGLNDLINEISLNGGSVDNFDRLFRTKYHSFDPKIDKDKFVNYQNYFWLVNGPNTVDISDNIDIDSEIIGQQSFVVPSLNLNLMNGMKVRFSNESIHSQYRNKDFFVEGVGESIELIDFSLLINPEKISETYIDRFDSGRFDDFPFDSQSKFPLTPEYITINRASNDLNSWSRYNRWVHIDVIDATAEANSIEPVYPLNQRARRPIIEFKSNIKLYNFGTIGVPAVDVIDNKTTDAFSLVEGSAGHYADGILLQEGFRVIFSADNDPDVRNKIYEVKFVVIDNKLRLTLQESESPLNGSVTVIRYGNTYGGSSWWFDGDTWNLAQQHTKLNQSPLFDLFDSEGNSYSDPRFYASDFKGNKIFGYDEGTGVVDPVLGFSLKYRNIQGAGSYLFRNYFMDQTITVSLSGGNSLTVRPGATFFKIGNSYYNVWSEQKEFPIPLITSRLNTSTFYYDLPLGLTRNPLNGPVLSMTSGDYRDHVSTSSEYRLISNLNPIPFAQMFIGKKQHSVIDAVSHSADHYNNFKLSFLKKITELDIQDDPILAVDTAIREMNINKTQQSLYYFSDMVPYGNDFSGRTWKIVNTNTKLYPLSSIYNPTELALRSVLIYLNGELLINGVDYEFLTDDPYVRILTNLSIGDDLLIKDYNTTEGNFIPPTPTKLGLYPKFLPKIYIDDTYTTPTKVIQCHDGSVIVAYDDYRDNIILEFEKRIYNNLKVEYKQELIDINSVIPGAFRNNEYSIEEIERIIQPEFIKWTSFYNIDPVTNTTFDQENPFSWNYSLTYNRDLQQSFKGSWRAVYQYLYDTDRPHTHPWEMLGFSEEPTWWEEEYGSVPYTSSNTNLWNDLESGTIRQGDREGTHVIYSRPGLSNVIPVDGSGNLVDPSNFLENFTSFSIRQNWKFGDLGPAENAWRRSSYWPFVIQKVLSLTKPASYCALMYDPARLSKNILGQWVYGTDQEFLNLKDMPVQAFNNTLTSGFSVYVAEIGRQRSLTYNQDLSNDLEYLDINLFYKVGGFVDKSDLQITIDAFKPSSTLSGAILEPEDYSLILNVSNPIKSTSISGIIIQKNQTTFSIKGFDTQLPYFNTYSVIRNLTTPAITVGGVSEKFIVWAPGTSGGETGLSAADTTTASSAATGTFYKKGQYVKNGDKFYIVKVDHRSGSTFEPAYFQQIPSVPIVGGATVQAANGFDKTSVRKIPYGTEFENIQQVYDFIIGYGEWLSDQGFIFDLYNKDLQSSIDWNYTSKEFLYWTTQDWQNQAIIALSPFAEQIKFRSQNSVVDNIFDSFYQYSLMQASGEPFPQNELNVSREDGVCTIKSISELKGIYFARLNSIQKEHAIVFNNKTIFNDTIFDIETGYRQFRMKLLGFRTANWNGDYFSPGFVYDTAVVEDWRQFKDYKISDVVRFNGDYYSAKKKINGVSSFNFNDWRFIGKKPVESLIPNFDYKIEQFEDFYSLDTNNFDEVQQSFAQKLIGYTPRVYLNNIFTDPVSQYKFYQGFIRDKGTKNSISNLSRVIIENLNGQLSYKEEWAFRTGYYGSYSSFKEIEIPLVEGTFADSPQILKFTNTETLTTELVSIISPNNLAIKPLNYNPDETFVISSDDSTDVFSLNPAGYVRFDDVDQTAFSESDILTLPANVLKRGNTVWLANNLKRDWNVLRYNLIPARLNRFESDLSIADQYNFYTDIPHRLSEGQIISIEEFNSTVDGVHRISSVPAANQFTIISTATIFDQELETSDLGLIFKFDSARHNSFDDLPSDNELLLLPRNSKVWIDSGFDNKWAVYQKTKNFRSFSVPASNTPGEQKLGWSISKKKSSSIFMVGNPSFLDSENRGNVFVYSDQSGFAIQQFKYGINRNSTSTYYDKNLETGFGWSVVYDDVNFINSTGETNYGLLFVGAPLTSKVTLSPISVTATNTSTLVEQGLLKISSIDPTTIREDAIDLLISPNPSSYERYGYSVYVANKADSKLLMVGAPQTLTLGTGTVYVYLITTSTVSTGSLNISLTKSIKAPVLDADVGSQWGASISGSGDESFARNKGVIAVGAPGYSKGKGLVALYSGTETNYLQVLDNPFDNYSNFGHSIAVSPSADYVFVSALNARDRNQSYGKVAVYHRSSLNQLFTLTQIISNPILGVGMKFGQALDVNISDDELVITAIGTNKRVEDTFDEYKELSKIPYVNDPNSGFSNNQTVYDLDTTEFFDKIIFSGIAYIYNRKDKLFRLADELLPVMTNTGTNFGYSISIDSKNVYVGAPAFLNQVIPDETDSAFYQYYKIDTNVKSWNLLRQQDNLVKTDALLKVTLIDSRKESVIDYLDVIDPLKGKIAGIASQELTYRSSIDPAIYSLGISSVSTDLNNNWLDENVGKLWWDLSTVKYCWYEQGEVEYRRNRWGSVFPGSSIDVYEWVETTLLPSQWAAIADTTEGLAQRISGQPKYPDDNVLSVKQIYNPISGTFTNIYYYWVKNSVIIPNKNSRKVSSYQVARLIEDPSSQGLRYIAVLSQNAIAVANVQNLLIEDRIHLNINSNDINSKIPRHTEWQLLQEGDIKDPPRSLENKMIDSLLGKDTVGNLVPDPTLKEREKYGISIRPRQSMFKDRFQALRNIIDYSNEILKSLRVTGVYSFENLNQQQDPPRQNTNEYDQTVEDNNELLLVPTNQLITAELICEIANGRIVNVFIINAGYGYKTPPTVEIENNNFNAKIDTEIDFFGRVIGTTIVDSGNQFSTIPKLKVRPYTVLVLSDETFNGKWTKFVWDSEENNWVRQQTQLFNTPIYWNYVDWESDSFDQFKDYTLTLDEIYELNSIEVNPGQYVKIKNGGLGYYIILERTQTNVLGNFDTNYDIVYSENGTIQISDIIWNYPKSNLTFDSSAYDQTLYDQAPDLELQFILTALKEDIFTGELKSNWNSLFFKAVRYALSEQKLLDWAFKTSFINVISDAGELSQPAVYRFLDAKFYEDYLKEAKPYHTQIRTFTTKYTSLENSKTYNTDFDLPSIYDRSLDRYITVSTGSSYLAQYPWKSWADAYGTTGTIRSNTITLKYDRISRFAENKTLDVVDQFICDGETSEFVLTWLAYPEKTEIFVTLGNNKVLDTDYTIVYYSENYGESSSPSAFRNIYQPSTTATFVSRNSYTKKFCKIVFLNFIPIVGSVLTINYKKSPEILNAVDRILNYYRPKSGMPGLDLDQLMVGMSYPKNVVEGLKFDYDADWDITAYDIPPWQETVSFYHQTTSTFGSFTYTNTLTQVQLNDVSNIVIGQVVNVISTLTNYFNTPSTNYFTKPDARVYDVNVSTNVVTINTTTKQVIPSGSVFEFWTVDPNLSVLDSEIIGGDLSYTISTDSNSIVIDGEGFITPNTSYGPEELIPGEINESLGINVYTKSPAQSPLVFSSSMDVVANTTITRELSVVPPSGAAVTVVYNNILFTSTIIATVSSGTTTIRVDNRDLIDLSDFLLADNDKIENDTAVSSFGTETNDIVILTKPVLREIEIGERVTFYRKNKPKIFEYIEFDYDLTVTNFENSNQFTIDWRNGNTERPLLIIPPQPVPGKLSYSVIGVGSLGTDYDTGFIDRQGFITDAETAQVQSLASIDTVKSAYVLVNGLSVNPVSTSTAEGFIITESNGGNRRAAVNVYNMPPGTKVINVWFFGTEQKYFNEIKEQIIPVKSLTKKFTATSIAFSNILQNVSDLTGLAPGVTLYARGPEQFNPIVPYQTQVVSISGNDLTVSNNCTLAISSTTFTTFEVAIIPSQYTETTFVEDKYNGELLYPPGNVKPEVANCIVEFYNEKSFGRRMLIPPHIDYYQVSSLSNTTYPITNLNMNGTPVALDINTIRVYVNGEEIRKGFDYVYLNISGENFVTIDPSVIQIGDVVAILNKPGTGIFNVGQQDYEYDILNNYLILCSSITSQFQSPDQDWINNPSSGMGWNLDWEGEIKVITYNNHDGMLMRTQVFEGEPSNRYKLSRPILNENYLWVTLNGIPLVNFVDFEVLGDGMTVQISDKFVIQNSDVVVIITFNGTKTTEDILGFRVFNDFFNRTHFKRLAKKNTARLTKNFAFDDTVIHVNNASKLIPPVPNSNIPGSVIIHGERVEFFKIYSSVENVLVINSGTNYRPGDLIYFNNSNWEVPLTIEVDANENGNITGIQYSINSGVFKENILTLTTSSSNTTGQGTTATFVMQMNNNVLGQLRRGTLGTSAKGYNEPGTMVIDQSAEQTVPFIEQILKQIILTTSTNNVYTISTLTEVIYFNSGTFSTSSYVNNGIVLSKNIDAADQLEVYYGGRKLNKSSVFYQDIDKAYDSQLLRKLGSTTTIFSTSTVAGLPSRNNALGTPYLITTTNQVWVYEDSDDYNSVFGYVYKGIKHQPPEFTVNTSTHQIQLNIEEGVQSGVRLVLVKKQFAANKLWNNGVSLLDSTTFPAKFIRIRLAELPDEYYYGGNFEISDNTGFALVDDRNKPLKEGF